MVHALARHFEARLAERGDDIEPVAHHAVLDMLEQVGIIYRSNHIPIIAGSPHLEHLGLEG